MIEILYNIHIHNAQHNTIAQHITAQQSQYDTINSTVRQATIKQAAAAAAAAAAAGSKQTNSTNKQVL